MEKFENKSLNKKIIANAVSTYFFIFCSWLFLFNKTNININNSFVKSHIKSSSVIHLGFAITYIVFISNSLFSSINFYGFALNHIIAKVLFLFLLGLLIVGMYRANNGKLFFTKEINDLIKKDELIDINGDSKLDERDKLTIIISHIPFIGFLNFGKYKDNELIENITKLNLVITTIFLSLYLFGDYNLSTLLLLFYTIYIVFIGINLFIQDKIININLNKIPSPTDLIILIKSFIKYFSNYIKNKDFENFSVILKNKIEETNNLNKENENNLNKLKESKIPSFLIYIPIINLIFIFLKNNKFKYHIENGISITLILSIFFALNFFKIINTNIYVLIIIPIMFGIGYTKYNLSYKMPFIHEFHSLFVYIKNILLLKGNKINKVRKKDEVLNLKAKNKD